jgi:hypothetical protein
VVEGYSPFIDGWQPGSQAINYLQVYDIHSDCLHPRLLSTYDFGPRAPHEFFWWKDPKHPGRSLAYVTFTIYSPDPLHRDRTPHRAAGRAVADDRGARFARGGAPHVAVPRARSQGHADERLHLSVTAATISSAIASDEVAAGDGALRTFTTRPTWVMQKSWSSSPSVPTHWARTPAAARTMSAGRSDGT